MKKLSRLFKEEDGFLSVIMTGTGVMIMGLVMLIILTILFISAFTKATHYYGQMNAALDFAVAAANINSSTGSSSGQGSNNQGITTIDTAAVKENFINAYCTLTGSTCSGDEFHIPGMPAAVKLLNFYEVNPGDDIPPPPILPGLPHLTGVTASQPGYVVYMEVLIWNGGLWEIEPATVSMKTYKINQNAPLN